MYQYRTMVSVFVAIAIAFAPMAAAWARAGIGSELAMPHAASHAVASEGTEAASPMEDCASMMTGAASTCDCPCCDDGKACSPQLCQAKCFKLHGLAQHSWRLARSATSLFRPTPPAHPPDWSDEPQPPPPRT